MKSALSILSLLSLTAAVACSSGSSGTTSTASTGAVSTSSSGQSMTATSTTGTHTATTSGATATAVGTTSGTTGTGTTGTTSGVAAGTTSSGFVSGACTASANCGSGYCNFPLATPTAGTCCEPITASEQLAVNDGTGVDAACCGTSTAPCQSLTELMQNVVEAGASGNVIVATHDASGATWTGSETLPVTLSNGVQLQAAGIYFTGTSAKPSSPYFNVAPSSPADTAAVSISGDDVDGPVFIGLAPVGATFDNSGSNLGISVSGLTLSLSNVTVSATYTAAGSDITVLNGAHLVVGPGLVTLGADDSLGARGYDGIYCQGSPGSPSSITDLDAGPGGLVLKISNNESQDLVAQDYCNLTLVSGLQLGAFQAIGHMSVPEEFDCDLDGGTKIDGNGLNMYGKASAIIANADIACFLNDAVGLYSANSDGGYPTVDLETSQVARAGCSGLYVTEGVGAASNVTFTSNYYGVLQRADGGIDVSGTSALHQLGGSTVVCNGAGEPGACLSGETNGGKGFNVFNNSVNPLNASDCEWDTATPTTYVCTDALATLCTPAIITGADAVIAPDPTALKASTIATTGAILATPLVCP